MTPPECEGLRHTVTEALAVADPPGREAQPRLFSRHLRGLRVFQYRGKSEDSQRRQEDGRRTRSDSKQDDDPNSAFRPLGNGDLNPQQRAI